MSAPDFQLPIPRSNTHTHTHTHKHKYFIFRLKSSPDCSLLRKAGVFLNPPAEEKSIVFCSPMLKKIVKPVSSVQFTQLNCSLLVIQISRLGADEKRGVGGNSVYLAEVSRHSDFQACLRVVRSAASQNSCTVTSVTLSSQRGRKEKAADVAVMSRGADFESCCCCCCCCWWADREGLGICRREASWEL